VQLSHTFWQVILGMILGICLVLIYSTIAKYQNRPLGHINEHRYDQAILRGGIKTGLDRYQIDNGYYPSNFIDLFQQPGDAKHWSGPYLDGPLQDPWGHNYIYEFPGKHNPSGYDLMSLGPDGKMGTEDDIKNWSSQ
jgi:type II secretion system protein G